MTGQSSDILASFEAPKGLESLAAHTLAVMSDEPCFLLVEENRLSESSRYMSRYQILKIVRQDRLVNAYIYLGPASTFIADQFQLLGGVVDDNGRGHAVHTVGELQEAAAELRNRPPHRELEPLPLQQMWQEQVDQKQRFTNRPSTFGPGGSLIRP